MTVALEWLRGLLAALGLLAAPESVAYYGYVEGDYLYLGPRTAGTVVEVVVVEGAEVDAGALIFRLDDAREKAALDAARARLAEAEAVARDRETGGRKEEVAAAEAQLAEARSKLDLAQRSFERSRELVGLGVGTEARLDTDRASLEAAKADVRRLADLLEVVQLPSREGQIEAARRAVDGARAAVDQMAADYADRTVYAPVAGSIERVFLEPGEYAAPGAPVVSLLPPGNLKIRFFVAEPARAEIRVGDRVRVGCSACKAPMLASVSRLSTQAEHTPPVIYSREERGRLVFAVEAKLDDPSVLAPGQPVDVRLER